MDDNAQAPALISHSEPFRPETGRGKTIFNLKGFKVAHMPLRRVSQGISPLHPHLHSNLQPIGLKVTPISTRWVRAGSRSRLIARTCPRSLKYAANNAMWTLATTSLAIFNFRALLELLAQIVERDFAWSVQSNRFCFFSNGEPFVRNPGCRLLLFGCHLLAFFLFIPGR